MAPVEVCIVQHGDKETGPGDPRLSPVGRAHAAITGRYLAVEQWDALYSSPLGRARETAGAIGEACNLSVRLDDRLRERMNWGDGAIAQVLTAFLADWAHATDDRSREPPSGCSSNEAGRRMREAIDDSIRVPGINHVIVVSHISPRSTSLEATLDTLPRHRASANAPGGAEQIVVCPRSYSVASSHAS